MKFIALLSAIWLAMFLKRRKIKASQRINQSIRVSKSRLTTPKNIVDDIVLYGEVNGDDIIIADGD